MKASGVFVVVATALVLALELACADPQPLQDLCVADLTSGVKVNGFVCKEKVTADDFFFAGIANPGIINNTMGSLVTRVNVFKIPGLNTLGVAVYRTDFAPNGLNPPHTHPRASEVVYVLDGTLTVGFITTANVLISKTISKGEVFVFPKGLVHYQKNNAKTPASLLSAFNSQLPGTQSIPFVLFGSSPPVPDNVLTKTFHIGTKEVQKIKARMAPKL